jgi:hypothetical protein
MICETCHGFTPKQMFCQECHGTGITSCCDTGGAYWAKDPDEELINAVALMFFDTMSVGCVPSEYARAMIDLVRKHDKERLDAKTNR